MLPPGLKSIKSDRRKFILPSHIERNANSEPENKPGQKNDHNFNQKNILGTFFL